MWQERADRGYTLAPGEQGVVSDMISIYQMALILLTSTGAAALPGLTSHPQVELGDPVGEAGRALDASRDAAGNALDGARATVSDVRDETLNQVDATVHRTERIVGQTEALAQDTVAQAADAAQGAVDDARGLVGNEVAWARSFVDDAQAMALEEAGATGDWARGQVQETLDFLQG